MNASLIRPTASRPKKAFWNPTPWHVAAIRYNAAAILLAAAAAKGHDYILGQDEGAATYPGVGSLALIFAEACLGAFLLVGALIKITWRLALLAFSMFAAVSFWKVIGGEPACGCFGKQYDLSPRIAFFLDALLVSALAWAMPALALQDRAGKRNSLIRMGEAMFLVFFLSYGFGYARSVAPVPPPAPGFGCQFGFW